MSKRDILIRGVEDEVYRRFRAEVIRRGMTLGRAISEAMEMWLSSRTEDRDLRYEEELNNRAFLRMREKLRKEHYGKIGIFCFGKLIGIASSMEEADEMIKTKCRGAKHVLVVRIGQEGPRLVRLGMGVIKVERR